MKKRSLLLVLLASTLLVGCKKNEEPPLPTLGGFVIGENVLNADLVKDNIEEVEEEVEELPNTLFTKKIGEVTFNNENIIDWSGDILVIKNDSGHVGFYSLRYQKYLLNPQFVDEWLKYNLFHDYYVGNFILIEYEGVQYFYDGLGNLIYKDSDNLQTDFDVQFAYGNAYLTIFRTSLETGLMSEYYYRYSNDNATLVEIDDINLDILEHIPPVVEEEQEFPIGSQFNTVFDLEQYGLTGKLASEGSLYTVFDETGNKKFTVNIPQEATISFVGNKLYYQISKSLPEEAVDYDYSNGNNKFSLESYTVDLTTGETTKVELASLLLNAYPLNSSGTDKYSVATLVLIDENKALSGPREYLIDSNGLIRDNVSDVSVLSFIKVGDNFFNQSTGILYDSTLKEIAYLSGCNPNYVEEYNIFVGNINDYYGLLDSNGKVLMEFEWDSISDVIQNNYVIAHKGGSVYRVNIQNGTKVLLANSELVYSANENLYIVTDPVNNCLNIETISGHLETISLENLADLDVNQINVAYADASAIVLELEYREEKYDYDTESYYYDYETKYVTYDINSLPNLSTLTPVGEEKTEKVNLGYDREDAIDLVLGTNKFNTKENSTVYYEYTVETPGYYSFIFDEWAEITIKHYNEDGYYHDGESFDYIDVDLDYDYQNYYDVYKYTTTEYLEKGQEIIVAVDEGDINYFDYHEFELIMEDGTDPQYPRIYTDDMKLDLSSGEAIYIAYTAKYDAVYDVNVADNVSHYVYYDEYNYTDSQVGTAPVTLNKGEEVVFVVYAEQGTVNETDFELTVSDDQVEGQSLFSANKLSTTEPNAVAHEYNVIANESTASVDATNKVYEVRFNTTYGYGTYQVGVYGNDKELIRTVTVSSGTVLHLPVLADENVYFEIDSNSYSLSDLQITVNPLSIEESAEYNVVNAMLTPEDTVKVYDMEITRDDLGSFELFSDYGATVKLISQNGEVILDQVASSSTFTTVADKIEKGTYYLVIYNEEDNTIDNGVKLEYNEVYMDYFSSGYGGSSETNSGTYYYFTNTSNNGVTLTARVSTGYNDRIIIYNEDFENIDYYGPSNYSYDITVHLEAGEKIYIEVYNMSSYYSSSHMIYDVNTVADSE